MTLQTSGVISLNDVRKELGIGLQAPFAENIAEDGGYVPINPCSPMKPSSPNPASLSEWYGYNHNAQCASYQFETVTCDTNSNMCNQVFNSSQATSSVNVIPMTGVSRNGDGLNEDWVCLYCNLFPNIEINIYWTGVDGTTLSVIYHFQGANFTSWNLTGNAGAYNGLPIPTGVYYYSIDYHDGSHPIKTGWIYIEYPKTGDAYSMLFVYGTTLSAACSGTETVRTTIVFPIAIGGAMEAGTNDDSAVNPTAPSGYYRRVNTNEWYFVSPPNPSEGQQGGIITQSGTCG